MKLLNLTMVLVLIFSAVPLAAAIERYDLEDFSIMPQQAIILEEGDLLAFDLLNDSHFMRVKAIDRHNTSIKLNVYPFRDKNTQVPFFGLDNVVYVDLDKDGVNDLALDIYEIKDRRVTLIILDLTQASDEPEIPQGQGLVVKDTGINYQRTFFAIGLIIVALLGILAYRKSNSSEIEEEKPKKEN